MFNDQIDNKYKTLIKHLVTSGYKCKKESMQRLYQKENIIVKFNSTDIIINDILDNRRYYFNLDTSNTFLINFLEFLTNNYSEVLV